MDFNLSKEEIKERTGVDLDKVKITFGVSGNRLYMVDLNGDPIGQELFGESYHIIGEIKRNDD